MLLILTLHLLFLIPDVTQRRITITIGAIGGAVVIAVVLAFVICFVCVIVKYINSKQQLKQEQLRQTEETKREIQRYDEKVSLEELQLHTNFIEKALPQLSDFEVLQRFLDFLHAILLKGLKDETIRPEITQVVEKALLGDSSHFTAV